MIFLWTSPQVCWPGLSVFSDQACLVNGSLSSFLFLLASVPHSFPFSLPLPGSLSSGLVTVLAWIVRDSRPPTISSFERTSLRSLFVFTFILSYFPFYLLSCLAAGAPAFSNWFCGQIVTTCSRRYETETLFIWYFAPFGTEASSGIKLTAVGGYCAFCRGIVAFFELYESG